MKRLNERYSLMTIKKLLQVEVDGNGVVRDTEAVELFDDDIRAMGQDGIVVTDIDKAKGWGVYNHLITAVLGGRRVYFLARLKKEV